MNKIICKNSQRLKAANYFRKKFFVHARRGSKYGSGQKKFFYKFF